MSLWNRPSPFAAIVAMICLLGAAAMGQQCDPENQNLWEGDDVGEWDDENSWSLPHVPEECDHVIFTYPSDTLMNLNNAGYPWGRRVLSLTVQQYGVGSLDLEDNVSRMLYVRGDMTRAAPIDDFVITMQANDTVMIGNVASSLPYGDGLPPEGGTSGFCWNIDGRGGGPGNYTHAVLSVADLLGCGSINAVDANITSGYRPPSGEGTIWNFTALPESNPGIIDYTQCDDEFLLVCGSPYWLL